MTVSRELSESMDGWIVDWFAAERNYLSERQTEAAETYCNELEDNLVDPTPEDLKLASIVLGWASKEFSIDHPSLLVAAGALSALSARMWARAIAAEAALELFTKGVGA